jgi:2-amino-4-hydroxy-6-hydroxymethyldihydropteridine diphosphokinase
MAHTFIGLSTNLNNKLQNLKIATQHLAKLGTILKESSIYQTESWGIDNQPDYLNQVILIDTKIPAQELITELLEIEKEMGRTREYKFAPRIIDLDILFYNQQIISSAHLTIPHPHIAERNFVLAPLAEIAPNFIHPVLKLPIKKILQICPDQKKYIKLA